MNKIHYSEKVKVSSAANPGSDSVKLFASHRDYHGLRLADREKSNRHGVDKHRQVSLTKQVNGGIIHFSPWDMAVFGSTHLPV